MSLPELPPPSPPSSPPVFLPPPSPDAPPDQPPLTAAPSPATRRPLPLARRVWVTVLCVLLFAAAVAVDLSNQPSMAFSDAVADNVARFSWMRWVLLAEVSRQAIIALREVSAPVNGWFVRLFQSFAQTRRRFPEPVRYWASATAKWAVVYLLLSWLLSVTRDLPLLTAPVVWIFNFWATSSLWQIFLYQLLPASFSILMLMAMAGGRVEVLYPDEVKTSFDDVWGQDAVLARVKETVTYLDKPQLIEAQGGYVPSGILLWGPPGTGKTLMAEAIAGTTGRPFVLIEPATFKATFVGVAPLKMRLLFRKLRRLSRRYGGVVAFFDEADELGNRGPGVGKFNGAGYSLALRHLLDEDAAVAARPAAPGGRFGRLVRDGIVMMGGGGDGVLQALLTQLSGLKKPRKGMVRFLRRWLGMEPAPAPSYRILVVLATNLPSSLDPAMLRPGRVDRLFHVGYPNKEGRQRTFEGYLAKVPHRLTPEQIERISLATPDSSGAVIKDMVNEALIGAIRRGADAVEWQDINKAKFDKQLGLPDGTEYSPRERHAVAVHEASHAVASWLMRPQTKIEVASIERTGSFGGVVVAQSIEESSSEWASDLESYIAVALASLVGERLFFGESGAGVAGDIEQATRIAWLMEGRLSMGERLASHKVLADLGVAHNSQASDALSAHVERRLRAVAARVDELLRARRAEVLFLTHALEVFRTMTGDDVLAVLEGRRGHFVDGGFYRSAGVAEMLESYHQAMLTLRPGASPPPFPLVPGVSRP